MFYRSLTDSLRLRIRAKATKAIKASVSVNELGPSFTDVSLNAYQAFGTSEGCSTLEYAKVFSELEGDDKSVFAAVDCSKPAFARSSTRSRLSNRYRRIVNYFSIKLSKEGSESTDTVSVPSALSSIDFPLTENIDYAPQHHYPRPEVCSGFAKADDSDASNQRHAGRSTIRAEPELMHLPATPASFDHLLSLSEAELPCLEYLLVYTSLLTRLSLRAQCQEDLDRQREPKYSSLSGDRPGSVYSLRPSDEDLLDDFNDTSYAAFARPSELRFLGGCRSFGEYMTEFCWYYGAEDKQLGYTEAELEEMIRSSCSPGLLRNMAIMDGLPAGYYLAGNARRSARHIAPRNGRSRDERELANGVGVSYTADRNYIWRRRIDAILNPSSVIMEEPEEADIQEIGNGYDQRGNLKDPVPYDVLALNDSISHYRDYVDYMFAAHEPSETRRSN